MGEATEFDAIVEADEVERNTYALGFARLSADEAAAIGDVSAPVWPSVSHSSGDEDDTVNLWNGQRHCAQRPAVQPMAGFVQAAAISSSLQGRDQQDGWISSNPRMSESSASHLPDDDDNHDRQLRHDPPGSVRYIARVPDNFSASSAFRGIGGTSATNSFRESRGGTDGLCAPFAGGSDRSVTDRVKVSVRQPHASSVEAVNAGERSDNALQTMEAPPKAKRTPFGTSRRRTRAMQGKSAVMADEGTAVMAERVISSHEASLLLERSTDVHERSQASSCWVKTPPHAQRQAPVSQKAAAAVKAVRAAVVRAASSPWQGRAAAFPNDNAVKSTRTTSLRRSRLQRAAKLAASHPSSAKVSRESSHVARLDPSKPSQLGLGPAVPPARHQEEDALVSAPNLAQSARGQQQHTPVGWAQTTSPESHQGAQMPTRQTPAATPQLSQLDPIQLPQTRRQPAGAAGASAAQSEVGHEDRSQTQAPAPAVLKDAPHGIATTKNLCFMVVTAQLLSAASSVNLLEDGRAALVAQDGQEGLTIDDGVAGELLRLMIDTTSTCQTTKLSTTPLLQQLYAWNGHHKEATAELGLAERLQKNTGPVKDYRALLDHRGADRERRLNDLKNSNSAILRYIDVIDKLNVAVPLSTTVRCSRF